MGNVQRICKRCGVSGPLEARYCPHCGYDSQASDGLGMTNQSQPPMNMKKIRAEIGKVALPILAGAASLALRAGWKVLQDRLANTSPEDAAAALRNLTKPQSTQQSRSTEPPTQRPRTNVSTAKPRRTVHIRSSWAVGDSNGNWRRGTSEHTLEFDD